MTYHQTLVIIMAIAEIAEIAEIADIAEICNYPGRLSILIGGAYAD